MEQRKEGKSTRSRCKIDTSTSRSGSGELLPPTTEEAAAVTWPRGYQSRLHTKITPLPQFYPAQFRQMKLTFFTKTLDFTVYNLIIHINFHFLKRLTLQKTILENKAIKRANLWYFLRVLEISVIFYIVNLDSGFFGFLGGLA